MRNERGARNSSGNKSPRGNKSTGRTNSPRKPAFKKNNKKKDFSSTSFKKSGDKDSFIKKKSEKNDFVKTKKSGSGPRPTIGKKREYSSKSATSFKFKEEQPPKMDKKTGAFNTYRKKGKSSSFEERKEYKRKTGIKTYTDKKDESKTYAKGSEIIRKKDGSKGFKKTKVIIKKDQEDDGLVRLNKYIANAGICSRREADTFIQTGVVTVNGITITELGYKVKPEDVVKFGDKPIIGEKLVYILLNKPKDYITTSKDPQNRRTVYDLVSGIRERVFPVGRLDRNTTGVLLLTNDGLLAEKLMHPRKNISKIYHVELRNKFSITDLERLRKGLELEDGFFKPDAVEYVEGMDKHHIGIEIHSGKNRIVRRLFETLEYDVVKLDRVVYAGLTKKGLTRGKWRFLKDAEVNMLKML